MKKLTAGFEQRKGADKIIIEAFFRHMFGRAHTGGGTDEGSPAGGIDPGTPNETGRYDPPTPGQT